MKEHPILFSTEMVQALLEGRKTITRRIVKDPKINVFVGNLTSGYTAFTKPGCISVRGKWIDRLGNDRYGESIIKNPYGSKGDVLWVRESHYRFGMWKENGVTKTGKQKWRFYVDTAFPNIRYLDDPPYAVEKNSHRSLGWYKRSSLFMEKFCSRIKLKITDSRVERLHDISQEDAKAEGVYGVEWSRSDYGGSPNYKEPFKQLWENINGEEKWNSNPWVWVISFERLDNYKPEHSSTLQRSHPVK